MENHDEFYRDNFINDQVGFEAMFPKPPTHVCEVVRAWRQRGSGEIFMDMPDHLREREHMILKEV